MKLSLCMALVALTCAIMPQTVHAQFLDGQVSAVDGDSLEMTGTRIRLFGIDAPEARQSCKRQQADWACGADAARQLAEGKQLYENKCAKCHQPSGAGDKDALYPVLAGQHYKYLLRQMTEIRDGHRRNANPDMVKVIKPYTNEQLVAISAYQASLKMPGSMCKPKAGGKKK